MTDHATEHEAGPRRIEPTYLSVPRRVVLFLLGGMVLGVALAGVGGLLSGAGSRRLLLAYLVAFAFVLSLSLGSLFFVLLQHLTRAGWSVVVRRPAEIFSLNILTVLLLFVPLGTAVWNGQLYPWAAIPATISALETDPGELAVSDATHPTPRTAEHTGTIATSKSLTRGPAAGHAADLYVHQQIDRLTRSKFDWLNRPAFLTRVGLYFLIWILIAASFFRWSRRQDVVGAGVGQTKRMEWTAGIAAIAFGLSLTFAAFDLLMSLDPHWYSTMYGVYFFAGCAVGGIALNLLAQQLLQAWRVLPGVLTVEHRRDLGRFLFAFVFFWGYIAFSQYMLLWYANIPETTRWFVVRGASLATGYANSWGVLLLALLFGHFLIPFLGIMSRHVKANQSAMLFWTIWLLAFHYLDLYWQVMPEAGPQLVFGLTEIGTLLSVICVYLLGASLIATRTSLLPIGDPRLKESVNLGEVY